METKLHLYTGEGKGKTTAAMGLALRSLGHGNRVLIAQFVKDGRSGELRALARLPQALVCAGKPVKGFVSRMTAEEKERTAKEQLEQARALIALMDKERPALVVLDELAMAVHLGLLGDQAAADLIDAGLAHGEVAVTGRCAPDWLHRRADYVSVVTPEKHPYKTEGLKARKGIEW